MENQLFKYEFTQDVVAFLLSSVAQRQFRGEDQAKSLLHVIELLKNPANKAELEEAAKAAKAKKEKEAAAKESPEEAKEPKKVPEGK